MSSFENQDRKLVRVPADLKRNLESVIYRSRTVLAECPFGHDVKVSVQIEYIPKRGPDLCLNVQLQRKRVSSGSRPVQSDEPMSGEHFEALLGAPLRLVQKKFVRFFQERGNKSASRLEWGTNGFPKTMTHVREINSICRRHNLGISFAETGEYDTQEGVSAGMRMKYKFYVLERARKASW